jgi:hypothetical protein
MSACWLSTLRSPSASESASGVCSVQAQLGFTALSAKS